MVETMDSVMLKQIAEIELVIYLVLNLYRSAHGLHLLLLVLCLPW
ncbi:hypothetical protein ES703_120466 [subsurface metagenome]